MEVAGGAAGKRIRSNQAALISALLTTTAGSHPRFCVSRP